MIAACGDESVIGAAFYLMEPVDGFTPREEMPLLHANDPAIRRAMGFEMVDAIAALSKVDLRRESLQASANWTAISSDRSAAGARNSRVMPNTLVGRVWQAFPESTKSEPG
jgi:aminoglycoside phosphotransferase (APT) family kinase protein